MLLAVVIVVAVFVFLGFFALVFRMVRDTARRQGKWGLNLQSLGGKAAACPGCGARLPSVRRPTSLRQALWGGWTCEGCGLELDKWGRRVE